MGIRNAGRGKGDPERPKNTRITGIGISFRGPREAIPVPKPAITPLALQFLKEQLQSEEKTAS